MLSKRTLQGVMVACKLLMLMMCMGKSSIAFGQPANDNCDKATVVTISNNGYGLGTFTSATADLTAATVQPGETFASSIFGLGLTQKTVWFKFNIPTTRSVKVSLEKIDVIVSNDDVGFTVYKTASCLPSNAEISTKLSTIERIGSTANTCVEPGDYLIQVTARSRANGRIMVKVETAVPGREALYDQPAQAYDFGLVKAGIQTAGYRVECQSLDDAAEKCAALSNSQAYTKSTWHVFTTPAYFDYISFLLGSGTCSFPGGLNTIGYKLYKGDARNTPAGSLKNVTDCDSFVTNGATPDSKIYRCGALELNTTYSIQLFFQEPFIADIRFAVNVMGIAPTKAPQPVLSAMPAANILGTLPSSANGETTTVTDYFGCNSRHSLHPCSPSLPAEGILFQGQRYNLSTFYTFKLATTSNVNFSITNASCYNGYFFRVFKKAPTNNCKSLDSASIVGEWVNSLFVGCLDPGEYTLQVSGRDSVQPKTSFYCNSLTTSPTPLCMLTNLGEQFTLNIRVNTVFGASRYALNKPGAYDGINVVNGSMQPLTANVTYTAERDTFGCKPTVLPNDVFCRDGVSQAMYREFKLADSGFVTFAGWNGWYNMNKVYAGDANALAAAQNTYAYPDRINGLKPQSACISWQGCWDNNVCLVPGTYTYASFSDRSYTNNNVSEAPTFRFTKLETQHKNLATAQNMGDVVDTLARYGVASLKSDIDYFSCTDNALPINDYQPCYGYTKAIYRQFYLKSPALVNIHMVAAPVCGQKYAGSMTLFSGKATDGAAVLKPMGWPYDCFQNANAPACGALSPGWYTVVSYGTGGTYGDDKQTGVGDVGAANQFVISITEACAGPKYNRPYKADIDTATKKPFLIEWAPNNGHTAASPKTDVTYTLPVENFNCTVDSSYLPACNNSLTKVAYYVFQTTQESYVQIDTKQLWSVVYAGDIRKDSLTMGQQTPIQSCYQASGKIQICRLQPGTYTLAVFNNSATTCSSVEPTVYIDRVGYSRFDHAKNAYDFGLVPGDKQYHSGKVGDVNPLDPNRAPSSDFIYCTTGSQADDPAEPACLVDYLPNIYTGGVNNALYSQSIYSPNWLNIPRRNLWYTFVVNKGGYVRVQINNKTIGKGYHYRFAIYKSNVDGSKPFSEVVSAGEVDSTILQGLKFVSGNFQQAYYPYYCADIPNVASFYRDPCNATPERYYILVENTNNYYHEYVGMKPNSQLEVSVMMDAEEAIPAKFDHYSSAGSFGTNLGPGTYTGETDNFTCATKDARDPNVFNLSCPMKTLWYKFTTTVTGNLQYRLLLNGQWRNDYSRNDWVQVFKEVKAGDSTSTGLVLINTIATDVREGPADNWWTWSVSCIDPGTYYIFLTGCNMVNQTVTPIIKIVEQAGDFCSAPVALPLSGPGVAKATAIIDCHTIGTDFGEFNPTLSCPNGALKGKYKTTWFRIDITGKDTVDITTHIDERTTAAPSEIKYRMMTGNCGAMQEQSCIENADTRNTYTCLAPGSYYMQVFTPVGPGWPLVTGYIDLNVSAVQHADTCGKTNNCLATAAFIPQFDCANEDAVTFVNYSTYGSDIRYKWDFGVGGQTSGEVAPQFRFPALATEKTYNVKLTVTNEACGEQSTYTAAVKIPGRPAVQLGADTTLCTFGSSLTLNAGTWAGTTYQWSTGETTPSISVSTAALPTSYWVQATYNGCVKRDTIMVAINPISKLAQTNYLCGSDSVLLNSARGFGEIYLWSTGATGPSVYARTGGLYISQLQWNTCTIRDSFTVIQAAESFLQPDTIVCSPFRAFTLNATAKGALGYQWQNGAAGATHRVTAPGTYWVKVDYPNCSLQDTFIVNQSPAVVRTRKDTTICGGQSYLTSWGQLLTQTGTYRDTVRYHWGCDSLVRTVNLTVIEPQTTTIDASICLGGTYTLPWGEVVRVAGIYRDTLRSKGGCDSLLRVIMLQVNSPVITTTDATICQGKTYTLPWGKVVSATGIYRDTLRHIAGCDSVIRIVNLGVNSLFRETFNTLICEEESYTLPWGEIVSSAGTYINVIRYASGCDSLVREVTVHVNSKTTNGQNAVICNGDSYMLPWGTVVRTAGTYQDTLKYSTGCDSVVRVVNLEVKTSKINASTTTICQGDRYRLPWGGTATKTGLYSDTLRYASGCDSLIRQVALTVQEPLINNFSVSLCSGQSYTLPSGTIVSHTGVYRDTLHYATGCDSIQRSVTVLVNTPVVLDLHPSICAGESYILPSGVAVTTAGIYRDTVRQAAGCDSLYRTITLRINEARTNSTSATVCEGEAYTLPWGMPASKSGIYRDTLRYQAGCDSVIREVSLTVKALQRQDSRITLCEGTTYTLPWGEAVSRAGEYRDTLRYESTGCDSLIRSVEVAVNEATEETIVLTRCEGGSYTLPWGRVVTMSGTYYDTLQYASGCDSLRRSYTITFQQAAVQTLHPAICAGDSYLLPWGERVSAEGVFRDTLRSAIGCDSVIRIVDLRVHTATVLNTAATICRGASYTLPWGQVANVAGTYRDTLRYGSGCDSIRRAVTLSVQAVETLTTYATICSGAVYTLPWGTSASSSGTYRDTLRYISGCDSVIREVNLLVQTSIVQTSTATACEGELYRLPWGQIATRSGTYRHTFPYQSGCDSLLRVVNLTVKTKTVQSSSVRICTGSSYTLPWGQSVTVAGTYQDTLHYQSGCDSVVQEVRIEVTAPATSTLSASICSDQTYRLPWGEVVNTAGIYRDTLRSTAGCDSLIQTVNLEVRPAPVLMLTKSNDIDCMLGTATLRASGASTYSWSPSPSLRDLNSSSPVVSPTTTTVYSVRATAGNGCTAAGSIEVKVASGDPQNGYLVPNAFTPNGDGKNDCFGVRHWGTVKNLRFTIYNRWGEIVFQTTEVSQCWNGNHKGKQEGSATFVYVITADTNCGKVLRKGAVNLIR